VITGVIRLIEDASKLLADINADSALRLDIAAVWNDIRAIFGIAARAAIKKDGTGDIPF